MLSDIAKSVRSWVRLVKTWILGVESKTSDPPGSSISYDNSPESVTKAFVVLSQLRGGQLWHNFPGPWFDGGEVRPCFPRVLTHRPFDSALVASAIDRSREAESPDDQSDRATLTTDDLLSRAGRVHCLRNVSGHGRGS